MLTPQEGYDTLIENWGLDEDSVMGVLYDSVHPGICLACGEESDSVEPDARAYTCQECGADRVYSLGELVFMGAQV
jgi:hypothetical protein